MLFQVNGCSLVKTGKKTYLMPKYLISKSGYGRYKQDCIRALRLMGKGTVGDDWAKLFTLHKEFLSKINYKQERVETHNIIGPLLMREGVCDGIVKNVKAFCDMMGIHCIVIRGGGKTRERECRKPCTECNKT